MSRYYRQLIEGSLPPNPLWSSLTNYYSLDSTPNDTKGSANGTLINGLGYTTGKINNGLNFDGVNDSFSLPDNFFKPSGDFSVSFWLNLSTISIYSFILDIGGGQQGYLDGLSIYYPPVPGDLRLYIDAANILSFGSLSVNTWYHVCLTHKTSTNYKAYLNGTYIGQKSTSKQITFPSTTYGAIGTAKDSSSSYSFYSPLKMDELAFFNSELTSTQVTELYNSGNGKQYPL
jgi:hypothetical protein